MNPFLRLLEYARPYRGRFAAAFAAMLFYAAASSAVVILIQPLMDGARPADVVANEADIAACKAKKSQLKKSN